MGRTTGGPFTQSSSSALTRGGVDRCSTGKIFMGWAFSLIPTRISFFSPSIALLPQKWIPLDDLQSVVILISGWFFVYQVRWCDSDQFVSRCTYIWIENRKKRWLLFFRSLKSQVPSSIMLTHWIVCFDRREPPGC